jgi:heat shock protein HslJ
LLLISFAVVSCRTAVPTTPNPQPAPVNLIGTQWRLEDLSGAGALNNVQATLLFPEAGKVAGKGSCNSFFGSVEINGNAIKIGRIGSTRMACAEPIQNQETKYLRQLEMAERFIVDSKNLMIYSSGIEKPMRFVRI